MLRVCRKRTVLKPMGGVFATSAAEHTAMVARKGRIVCITMAGGEKLWVLCCPRCPHRDRRTHKKSFFKQATHKCVCSRSRFSH